jgi:hypothetical protein
LTGLKFTRLQIILIHKILPVWKDVMGKTPYRDLPETAICLAEDIILGHYKYVYDSQLFKQIHGQLKFLLEEYIGLSVFNKVSFSAHLIIKSVLELFELSHIHPFPSIHLHHGKITLPEYNDQRMIFGDLAGRVGLVYSGIFTELTWTQKYDLAKKQEFWQWWLSFAIPWAWAKVLVNNAPEEGFAIVKKLQKLTKTKKVFELQTEFVKYYTHNYETDFGSIDNHAFSYGEPSFDTLAEPPKLEEDAPNRKSKVIWQATDLNTESISEFTFLKDKNNRDVKAFVLKLWGEQTYRAFLQSIPSNYGKLTAIIDQAENFATIEEAKAWCLSKMT